MSSPNPLSRRDALKTLGAGAALLGVGAFSAKATAAEPMPAAAAGGTRQPFTLPPLAYAYEALEPHIDARTMEIHHKRHHQAYIDNATRALADQPALQKLSAEEILKNLDAVPAPIRSILKNNVGGHVNHAFFWRVIGPGGGGLPTGGLAAALDRKFGSFDAFKTQFAGTAQRHFGSGWAWLVVKGGALELVSTANQDSPISEGAVPILGLDVWEHAYYLKYQNQRPQYVAAFWNVVNWPQVTENHARAAAV
jgi:superoxide dismutase, Fe-Mn family